MDWNKILNWRLLSGSHKFPGPDGGTCINEAAIVEEVVAALYCASAIE